MFVAVVPPEEAVEDLEEFLAPRRGAATFRWSSPEQWHLTLAFAASAPDRVYDDLLVRLGDAAARRTPLELQVIGGGAFPDPSRAKVLFAGLRTDDRGAGSAGHREPERPGDRGVEVDGQRFRPHLTLARAGRPVEATKWVRLLDSYEGPRWTVREIALVASHLGEGPRGRPRHEVVETFSLGPAGSGPAPPDAPPRGR